jgi:cyanophycin synthetase
VPTNDLFYGYDFQLRQPCFAIRREFTIDPTLDIATIDAWIVDRIGLEVETFSDGDQLNGNRERSLAVAVLDRAVALYGEVLNAAGMPCPGGGRTLRVEPREGADTGFAGIVALQVVDNIPPRLFADIFGKCLGEVLRSFSKVPDSDEAADAVLEAFSKDVIAPLGKFVPFKAFYTAILGMAAKAGIPWRHLGANIVRLGWGARSQLLQSSQTDRDSAIGASICRDKHLTARILHNIGLPAPEHHIVSSTEEAISAAEKLGWPVVVKPVARERSEGVTVNIGNHDDLLAAYAEAARYPGHILVERHVPGDCHRLMIANGQLIYCVRRIPKGVKGDGKRTVEELVDANNAFLRSRPPWRRFKSWPKDAESDDYLARQGLDWNSVPEKGQRVSLRGIPSSAWGGNVDNLTADVHPDNRRLAIEATRAVGLTNAGVDLIIEDVTRPWHEQGAIINEMNHSSEFFSARREEDAARVIPAIVDGDGRIRVHLVTGEGDLLGAARAVKAQLAQEGRRCHLTTASHSEDPDGETIVMPLTTLFERGLAMTMRGDVEEFVMAGPIDELAQRGFPVDRFETVQVLAADEASAGDIAARIKARVEVARSLRLAPRERVN